MNPYPSQDFTAKLSDFGLARMGPEGSKSHVTTRIMGTYGYAAPEYVSTVCFPILPIDLDTTLDNKERCVQLWCGTSRAAHRRRCADKMRPKAEQNLVDWATPCLSNSRKLNHVIDPRLAGQHSVKGVNEIASLALKCVSLNLKDRPVTSVLVRSLESMQNYKDMAAAANHIQVQGKGCRLCQSKERARRSSLQTITCSANQEK
ncbi:putative serine/threonine-protein kinase PBL15 [Drosera capensis]